jgi:hypothetical protein
VLGNDISKLTTDSDSNLTGVGLMLSAVLFRALAVPTRALFAFVILLRHRTRTRPASRHALCRPILSTTSPSAAC